MEPQQPNTQPETPAPVPQPASEMPPAPVTPPEPMTGPVVGSGAPQVMPSKGGGMLKNKNVLLAILIGALLVLGGGAYAVYAYVTNTPDYLINQATSQLWQNTVAAKLKISTNQGGTDMTFNGDFALQIDQSNTKNAEVVVGLGTGTSRVTITAEVFEEALYFKLGSLQNIGNLAQSFGGDAASIYGSPEFVAAVGRLNDKWFSLSKDELKALAKQSSTDSPVTGSVSADDAKQLVAIYNHHPFFRPDKVLADQVIEGVNSAHFTLKIDKDQLKAFLTELKAANLKTFQVTDQDIKDAAQTPATSGDVSIDFWIARDTKKLRQVQVMGTDAGAKSTVTITFETNLPKLDKIQKPANSLPLSKFMETLLGPDYAQMMGGSF